MLDTITSSYRPSAASQSANTSKIMSIRLARVQCVFRTIRVDMMNSDNIIPSRHSSEDIK